MFYKKVKYKKKSRWIDTLCMLFAQIYCIISCHLRYSNNFVFSSDCWIFNSLYEFNVATTRIAYDSWVIWKLKVLVNPSCTYLFELLSENANNFKILCIQTTNHATYIIDVLTVFQWMVMMKLASGIYVYVPLWKQYF